jgi:hypothetical protein
MAPPPGPAPPAPPAPLRDAMRVIPHPDMSTAAPVHGKYLQDPVTGQVYFVVMPPSQVVQLEPDSYAPTTQSWTISTASYPSAHYTQAEAAQPLTVVPLPEVMPISMHQPIEAARHEEALLASLQSTQQQAAQLEGEIQRLQSMVNRLSYEETQRSTAYPVQTGRAPIQAVAAPATSNARPIPSGNTGLMPLFQRR